jgi:hypothetical protein
MNGIVRINAGGKIFETLRSTLTNIDYFECLFGNEQKFKNVTENDQCDFFIDIDPKIFRHWLSMTRTDSHHVPRKIRQEVSDFDAYLRGRSTCALPVLKSIGIVGRHSLGLERFVWVKKEDITCIKRVMVLQSTEHRSLSNIAFIFSNGFELRYSKFDIETIFKPCKLLKFLKLRKKYLKPIMQHIKLLKEIVLSCNINNRTSPCHGLIVTTESDVTISESKEESNEESNEGEQNGSKSDSDRDSDHDSVSSANDSVSSANVNDSTKRITIGGLIDTGNL